MKYFLIYFFLFWSLFSFGQNLSGKITYKKIINRPTEVKEKKTAEFFNKTSNAAEGLEYYLLFHYKESIFSLKEYMNKNDGRYQSRAESLGGGSGKYYKNLTSNIILHQTEFFGTTFLIQIPVSKYDWKITGETKNIGNYLTRKAIASYTSYAPSEHLKDKKIKTEVWFTPEIPLPFGPIDYSGLPGLILEAKTGLVTYRATKVDIHTNGSTNEEEIIKPTKGKLIAEKELSKKLKEMMKNLRNN